MRKVFVDVGANIGDISAKFASQNSEFDIICIEPNLDLLLPLFLKSAEVSRVFAVIWAAAWIEEGTINLFQSTAHEASTILSGKVEHSGWPQIDYGRGILVPSINFSSWLRRTLIGYDEIIIKMDIEGAEYDVLEKMIAEKTIGRVNKLFCEWHIDRYPHIGSERHHNIRSKVAELTDLQTWS